MFQFENDMLMKLKLTKSDNIIYLLGLRFLSGEEWIHFRIQMPPPCLNPSLWKDKQPKQLSVSKFSREFNNFQSRQD